MRPTHITVERQIPEFIRESYPLFVEFVQQYYRFLEQSSSYNITTDFELANDSLLNEFYNAYAKGLPVPTQMSKKQFLTHCKEYYSSKGTSASFNFLFKAFFGKETIVTYPGDNIIRASDGRWEQYHSIDIELSYQNTTNEYLNHLYPGASLNLTNENGVYFIKIEKLESLSNNRVRLFFKKTMELNLIQNQLITFKNNNVTLLIIKLVKTVIRLDVLNPGKKFQRGSIVKIKGSMSNTIARVTSVDANKGIKTLEVIEYGYQHADGDLTVVSPYANKPLGANYEINSVLSSGSYAYTLTINDYLDVIIESVDASHTIVNQYNTIVESIHQESAQSNSDNGISLNTLTIGDWLDSRATIRVTEGMVAAHLGKYNTTHSLISDPLSCIQDNFYYQIYSYVIRSEVDEVDYKKVLPLIHPAGLKRFGEINKTSRLNGSLSVDYITMYQLNFDEVIHLTEELAKTVNKPEFDGLTIDEAIAKIYGSNSMADSTSMQQEVAVYTAPSPYTDGTYFAETYDLSGHILAIN